MKDQKIETKYKEVQVYVCKNGFNLFFKDYVGSPEVNNNYVARDLKELQSILKKKLVAIED